MFLLLCVAEKDFFQAYVSAPFPSPEAVHNLSSDSLAS
jgi:hypothetical protein